MFGKNKAKGRGVKRPRLDDGETQDEWRRPKEKVSSSRLESEELIFETSGQLLLLSGPPGLGKTTLAHVVAKHAGYSVFEVNARYAICCTNVRMDC